MDIDHNGKISLDDFKMLITDGRITEEQITEMLEETLKEYDLNGDREIDFEEFCTGMKKEFKTFDKNKDGFITAEELRRNMESKGEKVTKEEIDAIIQTADKNGDGKISIEEYMKM